MITRKTIRHERERRLPFQGITLDCSEVRGAILYRRDWLDARILPPIKPAISIRHVQFATLPQLEVQSVCWPRKKHPNLKFRNSHLLPCGSLRVLARPQASIFRRARNLSPAA